jgi:hypothetical protein
MICPLVIWADEYTTPDTLDDIFYRQTQVFCKAKKTFAKGTTVELQKNLRNILSKDQLPLWKY